MPRSKTKTLPGYETPFATRLRELIDAIRNLQGVHFEQNPENDYKITAKPAEPLPEMFSNWLEAVDLSLLTSDMWRMVCSTVSSQDSGWNNEKYKLNPAQKNAIWDLKEHGYVTLSMTQQVSFFIGTATETFNHALDKMINETIAYVDEQNSPKDGSNGGAR